MSSAVPGFSKCKDLTVGVKTVQCCVVDASTRRVLIYCCIDVFLT